MTTSTTWAVRYTDDKGKRKQREFRTEREFRAWADRALDVLGYTIDAVSEPSV